MGVYWNIHVHVGPLLYHIYMYMATKYSSGGKRLSGLTHNAYKDWIPITQACGNVRKTQQDKYKCSTCTCIDFKL